ncbi:MAG: 2-C-methyl-D-erythritol 4-phosphate cytidylyltransferase [Bacteroidales bacterium]|nr:2-C-methyl-D-erythritol 4-phosphate cytidylyltransferase [Bacteroidales bacterium]
MITKVIILAGGKGTRYGGKKQFAMLQGKQLWQHIYEKVAPFVPKEHIVVVGIDVESGSTRNRSVQHGLAYFQDGDRAMIFDAARPMVTQAQVTSLLEIEVPSATFAIPVVDTLVKTDGTPVNRSEYWRVQTPQAFDFKMLWNAIKDDRYALATDETQVMFDEYGIRPMLLEGGDNLMKVTYPNDLLVLENILTRMSE